MRTFEEYKDSLRDGRIVYYRGEKVDDVSTHPILSKGINHMGRYFGENVEDKELKARLFIDSPEFGGKISSFYKVPRSSSDLLERSQFNI